jgi:hypothetical protein
MRLRLIKKLHGNFTPVRTYFSPRTLRTTATHFIKLIFLEPRSSIMLGARSASSGCRRALSATIGRPNQSPCCSVRAPTAAAPNSTCLNRNVSSSNAPASLPWRRRADHGATGRIPTGTKYSASRWQCQATRAFGVQATQMMVDTFRGIHLGPEEGLPAYYGEEDDDGT